MCSAGLLRSPTTAVLLSKEYGFNTRACGVDKGHALIPLTNALLFWSDEVVCMDVMQKQAIEREIEEFNNLNQYIPNIDPQIYVLNVPDRYGYMDEELQKDILTRYKEVRHGKKESVQE